MTIASVLQFRHRKDLPVILAAEGAECGLACLAMVARYHGHNVDLNSLRQRFPTSMAGSSLRGLMSVADRLDLSNRAVRAELEGVRQLTLPAILHWDLNHFVVLKTVGRKAIVIHDPAAGEVKLSWAEFSLHFTGVALELSPTPDFSALDDRHPLKLSDLWTRIEGVLPSLSTLLILSLALQIVVFAAPFQVQLVVDEAVMRGDKNLLLTIALAFGSLVVIQAALEWLRGWTLQVITSLASLQVMGSLVRHLLRLKAQYFEKRHVGDILSRMQSSRTIQDILTRGAVSALIDGLIALAASAILFIYSVQLALVAVAATLLNLFISMAFFPLVRKRSEEQLSAGAEEQSNLMENVRAATSIKLMGGEGSREATWRNLYTGYMNASIRLSKLTLTQGSLQTAVNGLQYVIILYLGAKTVLQGGGLSIGMLFAFLSFRQTFSDRANTLIGQFVQLRLIRLHLDRLSDIVQSDADPSQSFPLRDPAGAVSLQDVAFRYGETDRWVFRQLSLDVAPGEFLAITGSSGCGKTTLLKMLLGLIEPQEGKVTLDGQDATAERWRAWREHVGLVAQDDRLLSGSLADNIAFFDPDLSMERVIQAAVAAQIHDEIMRMPMQYLSLVGDMGSTLSGGQKQRVILARALYRMPKVLILDEGTANLDVKTEETVAELVSNLPMTRIIVAHRPALLRRAHRVLVLDKGGLSPGDKAAFTG